MRKKLKELENLRKTFSAVFNRYGSKTNWNGFPEKTILLIDVRDSNKKKVADHIWFSMTKGFEKMGKLTEGTKIQFNARVKKYIKGYAGYKEDIQFEKPIKEDYKLNNPTQIKLI